jgi:peptidoglycan/xylan/chitin deacetylase (PgdA/CDA1 family)
LNLTFDDGPDPQWTPQILQPLARDSVVATFFMVGERVAAEPALAKRVLAAGHEIQLHCHRHIRHTELSERELQRDTETALATLESVGVSPSLWRAPWGACTEASRRIAERLGLELVRWSIDTHDWRGDPPRAMLYRTRHRLAEGGAVLMHDAVGPGARRVGCENTVALVPELVRAARAGGLSITSMRGVAARVTAVEQPDTGVVA